MAWSPEARAAAAAARKTFKSDVRFHGSMHGTQNMRQFAAKKLAQDRVSMGRMVGNFAKRNAIMYKMATDAVSLRVQNINLTTNRKPKPGGQSAAMNYRINQMRRRGGY